ncbi:hypothetical protein DCE79_18175 [Lysinibacillus sp. 2017]|nr:ABC transporter permease subunit [Lysinibacillus sp. S2017]AWE09145.1 hypothetical protein DCE79_18175 [Lysinibacillus sp. 2017]TGN35970.1 hypothetical protein E4L99_07440 [Lysinibacillus sp. S2017]
MIRLIQFEMKKLWRSSYFMWLLMVLVVVVLAFYVYIYANTTSIDTEITKQQDSIYTTEQHIAELNKKIEAGIKEPGVNLEKEVGLYNEMLATDYLILNALEQQDWSAYFSLLTKNHEYAVQIANGELLQQSYNTYMWPTPYTTISLGEKYAWMQKYVVEPVFPIHTFSWMTTYDEEFSDAIVENFVLTSSNKHSSTGLYFSYELFAYGLSLIGIVYFLFLFSDLVTKEGYGRNGPIQFLWTQPIKRYQILMVKLIAVMVISIMLLALVWGLAMLLGITFNNGGDWYYPVLIYGENNHLSFIGMGLFLLKSFSLFLMFLLFSYSLLFLFSVLTNRAIIALGLTIMTIFVGIQIINQSLTFTYTQWVPFHYVNVFEVVSNEYAVRHDQFAISYETGMLTLFVGSVIILLFTFVLSKLKQGGIR